MKQSNYKIQSLLFSSVLILQLIFLYFIKYSNQLLTLREFSFANIGNLFNLFVTISAILGIVLYLMKKKSAGKLIFFLSLLTFLLIISYLSTLTNIPSEKVYILGQPGPKIFDAALFTIYQFALFTFISFLWLNIAGFEKLILMKSLLNGILMLFFFLIVTYVFILTKVKGYDDLKIQKDEKNVIVVLGAAVWSDNQPSPSLSGRVDRAIELYRDNYAGEIILTGGNAPGEKSEAEVAMEYARREGIDMSVVKLETSSSSTTEQISFIKNNLFHNKNVKEIIVVSDSYHLVRVLEISHFFNVDIKVAASKMKLNEGGRFYRELRESIALIVFWSFAL